MPELTYPLSHADFIDDLPIQSVSFELPESLNMSRTGDGEVINDKLGNPLWRGTITLGRLTPFEAAEASTLIDLIRGPARPFYIYDVRRPGPRQDPIGANIGAGPFSVFSIRATKRSLIVQGLPFGYQLSRGDYLSIDYDNGPVRRSLHRVVDKTVTAFSTGRTPEFQVEPAIPPSIAVNAPVTLVKAGCKALLVPGSVEIGQGGRWITEGQSFQFVQTMR